MTMAKKEHKQTFEQSLRRLEEVVETLERGEVPLEDSLRLYEEGIGLSNECLAILKRTETRIKQLSKDLSGRIQLNDTDGDV